MTSDIAVITNEDAIKNSVKNLIRTRIGERFFNSLLGSRVEDSLFELATNDLTDPLEEEIRNVITNFEPRVNLRQVIIEPVVDSNQLNITIVYDIVGLAFPTQTINFVLQPTRY